jgi:hypothetical protein
VSDGGYLTADEVYSLLDSMDGTDPIVVGGQSINIWASRYENRSNTLAGYGPFTSKDIDFYRNEAAARRLAEALIDGTLLLPGPDDHTPNAAQVVGKLQSRPIIIDFMRVVEGVQDRSLQQTHVTLDYSASGSFTASRQVRIKVMHPLDCLASRLANIVTLRRHYDLSVRQGRASVEILRLFIGDLLALGERKEAQRCLLQVEYLGRKKWAGTAAHLDFGLDLLGIMRAFRNDMRLDKRWRELTLAPAIARLKKVATFWLNRRSQQQTT